MPTALPPLAPRGSPHHTASLPLQLAQLVVFQSSSTAAAAAVVVTCCLVGHGAVAVFLWPTLLLQSCGTASHCRYLLALTCHRSALNISCVWRAQIAAGILLDTGLTLDMDISCIGSLDVVIDIIGGDTGEPPLPAPAEDHKRPQQQQAFNAAHSQQNPFIDVIVDQFVTKIPGLAIYARDVRVQVTGGAHELKPTLSVGSLQ